MTEDKYKEILKQYHKNNRNLHVSILSHLFSVNIMRSVYNNADKLISAAFKNTKEKQNK